MRVLDRMLHGSHGIDELKSEPRLEVLVRDLRHTIIIRISHNIGLANKRCHSGPGSSPLAETHNRRRM